MTVEDKIEQLCTELYNAIDLDGESKVALGTAIELLAGFLKDINRIARYLEQIDLNGRPKP